MSFGKMEKTNPIRKRHYILIVGTLSSPLLCGSGESENASMDAVLDGRGIPYIPGSSLAGALRQYLTIEDKNASEILFGSDKNTKRNGEIKYQSPLFVYDTKLLNGQVFFQSDDKVINIHKILETARSLVGKSSQIDEFGELLDQPRFAPCISKRDGVKLDEYKTAEDQGKFDMQMVEAGNIFIMRLGYMQRENDKLPIPKTATVKNGSDTNRLLKSEDSTERFTYYVGLLLNGIQNGEITIGARSRKGFGTLKITAVYCKTFEMRKKNECENWLSWNWNLNDFMEEEKIDLSQLAYHSHFHCLRVPLKIKDTIMIRKIHGIGSVEADYEHLQSGSEAVIPGSSFMGAIRSRVEQIIQEILQEEERNKVRDKLTPVFGTWINEAGFSQDSIDSSQEIVASSVKVEESRITGGHALPVTRTSIDRFTGGVKAGALFTEILWVGGKTELVLRYPREIEGKAPLYVCGLLLWAIFDLQDGFLPVGGETGVGRGIFERNLNEKHDKLGILLDGRPLSEEEADRACKAAIQCLRGEVLQ